MPRRVLQQIAENFREVIGWDADRKIWSDFDGPVQRCAFRRPPHNRNHTVRRCLYPRHGIARRRAATRPRKLALNMPPHGLAHAREIIGNFVISFSLQALDRTRQHLQRRLQPVGKVGGARAGN